MTSVSHAHTIVRECCKAMSTLSQTSETVAENGDSLTFLRHCGQGLSLCILTNKQRSTSQMGQI